MKFKKAKLFWIENLKRIESIPYDGDIEYYAFLRKYREKGYKQVVITSEIMIQIIKEAYLKNQYHVYKMEFVEEDDDLQQEINALLSLIEQNSGYLTELLDKLKFLSEKSSIDLKRIYVKGEDTESNPVVFFVQSNGIIGINSSAFLSISKELCGLVERCLF